MRKITFIVSTVLSVAIGIVASPSELSSVVLADTGRMRALPAIPINDPALAKQMTASTSEQKTDAAKSKQPVKTPTKNAAAAKPIGQPVRVIIPSIGLDAPIQKVGLNGKGEIAVPSGQTINVGWYKYGAKPGEKGTAILDAHVFAAFENLKYVPKGASIYIVTESGAKLHFIVGNTVTYALANLSSRQLFTGLSDRAMNLITCAGSLTADGSTYTHRLVLFTTLVDRS